MEDFFSASSPPPAKKNVQEDGVRISCSYNQTCRTPPEANVTTSEEDEDAELIWWEWTGGPLRGFDGL